MQAATTVQDTLSVQRELTRVSGDLEALKGRLNYLDRSSSMSTIHLTLSSYNWSRPTEPEPAWSPLRTLSKVRIVSPLCDSTCVSVPDGIGGVSFALHRQSGDLYVCLLTLLV